jgi:hypothetical protein
VGYLLLPFELLTPFHWWGMNVRLVPLMFLWMLVATPAGSLSLLGRAVILPVALATAGYLAYIAYDFRVTFNGPGESRGLSEVIAALPKGARVEGIYTDLRAPLHYSHYPYEYAASYAVVMKGGISAPFTPIPQAWTNPKEVPAHPASGDAASLRIPLHTLGFTHFLVRTCEGAGCAPDPLADRPEFARVMESDRWRLYQCVGPGCLQAGQSGESAGSLSR